MPIVGIGQNPYDGYWAEIILHCRENGIFEGVWIEEAIRECVIEHDLWVNKGDFVKSFTSANYAIGTLVLRFENQEQLQEVMDDIEKYVKVMVKEKQVEE